MDCKDLMIGDWVYNKHHKKNIQIKPYDFFVHGHGNNVAFVVSSTIVSGKDFEPIPITEEILVKNGFKKESQTIDGDYCKFTLPGFALNWCDTDGFWYQNGDITPNYIHTLQHLLRLCGIEKEIEL